MWALTPLLASMGPYSAAHKYTYTTVPKLTFGRTWRVETVELWKKIG